MDLISKKELLAQTGISYGQLYRWKRERLIPEEWFLKKASYTGQETFFPKEQVLGRITSILELKDDYSLEELGRLFSSENQGQLSKESLSNLEGIGKTLGEYLQGQEKETYSLLEVAFLVAVSDVGTNRKLGKEHMEHLMANGLSAIEDNNVPDVICTFFQTGDQISAVFSKDTHLFFDKSIEILETRVLTEIMGNLKAKNKKLLEQSH